MSDQGEKTCPLCAEEMDLTDQQLKPCRCGYQICVWCWHHIMDMAEKDETEGRCPACRSPYDKEKIVGMAANCERHVERKKLQKSKAKPSESRKQLSSVRVIQRNLVYIVGLPLNLADEDVLQRKEYFGQYGRVLKVSMSRTAAGVIQQFPNNTCSVYVTYSKEEEAIRCIQSVHGFVLDGRSLKACFGTTKYCHAWLRNVPCNNPDCLYLHEIGSQEDSFTKDEIISAYTRSRVQQITGATSNLQQHSGNMLPPPADEYCTYSSSAKPIVKSASNSTASVPKSSPPNGSSGTSGALPAAASWGTRASNQQSVPRVVPLNGSSNHLKPGLVNGTLPFSSVVTNMTQVSELHGDVLKKLPREEDCQAMADKFRSDLPKSLQGDTRVNSGSKGLNSPVGDPTASRIPCSSASIDNGGVVGMPSIFTDSFDLKEVNTEDHESIPNLCINVASMSINENSTNDHCGVKMPSNQGFARSPGNEGLLPQYAEQYRILSPSRTDTIAATLLNGVCVSRAESDGTTDLQSEVGMHAKLKSEGDILSFDSQRLKDPDVMSHSTYLLDSANSNRVLNHSGFHSSQYTEAPGLVNSSSDSFLDDRSRDRLLISNEFAEKPIVGSIGSSATVEKTSLFASEGEKENQTGEDHIISNILSLNFDPWDDSLSSPQNLAKLLGETDQQTGSLKLSNSLKVQHNSQSRFSFARQEECNNQEFHVDPYSVCGQPSRNQPSLQDSATSRDLYLDKPAICSGFVSSYTEGLENFSTNPVFSSNKISVSRAQISPPPGFTIPNRSPPPGFSSKERMAQTFDASSGTCLLDSTSLFRNSYQSPALSGNGGAAGDIEFMDPAILAVGRGRLQGTLENAVLDMRSSFLPQLNSFESDARHQLLMHRSLSSQQTIKFPDIRESNFSTLNGSYGFASRPMDQSQGDDLSSFTELPRQHPTDSLMSNCHWDRWSEVHGGNSLGMAEILRNERMGLNINLYNGLEESKFQMPSSGDFYNRTYRM